MAYNIMVVDDSDVIRAMIARTINLASVPVNEFHHAANGKEALRVLDERWIDLVLADINMPVMDGEEMLRRMRERPETADIPVIVVSTEGATERVSQLLDNGVSAWVRKPFTPEEIRDVIAQVTDAWPTQDEQAAHVDAVIGPVLEVFAFAFPEPIETADAAVPEGEILCANITFNGAVGGTMTILAPECLCGELAANILGLDAEDDDARVRGADTLGEIANIAAGHIATRIEPNEQTDLHPPIVSSATAEEWGRIAGLASARTYLVEGRPFVVSLALRPQKAPQRS